MPTCTLLIYLGVIPFTMIIPPASEMPLTDCEQVFTEKIAPSLVEGVKARHTVVDIEPDCGKGTDNKCKGRAE